MQTAITTALLSDFIGKFREITDSRGISVVADELGVSRQALSACFRDDNPSIPSFDLMVAAMERYGIVLDTAGFVFGARSQVTPTFESDQAAE